MSSTTPSVAKQVPHFFASKSVNVEFFTEVLGLPSTSPLRFCNDAARKLGRDAEANSRSGSGY